MKANINTQKKIYGHNNGVSFPQFPELSKKDSKKKINKNCYTIILDWLQFICSGETSIINFNNESKNSSFYIESNHTSYDPNFSKSFKVFFKGDEICVLNAEPNNKKYQSNELVIKVSNYLLYSNNYINIIKNLLNELQLKFIRLQRIDIALDGKELMRLENILNRYFKSHTIQINNNAINVIPTSFRKNKLKFNGWKIGNEKSGISARVYCKSSEILMSQKNYIKNFWRQNNIESDLVGRFEIQLNNKRLKKYGIKNIEILTSTKILCSIFENEVKSWLKFYSVRKKDYLNHKKEIAIKKGREINYIKWNKLPETVTTLNTSKIDSKTKNTHIRNIISFILKDSRRKSFKNSLEKIEGVKSLAIENNLEGHYNKIIQELYINVMWFNYLFTYYKVLKINNSKMFQLMPDEFEFLE